MVDNLGVSWFLTQKYMRLLNSAARFVEPTGDLGPVLDRTMRIFGMKGGGPRDDGTGFRIVQQGLLDKLEVFSKKGLGGGLLETFLRMQVNRAMAGYEDGCRVNCPADVERIANRLIDDIRTECNFGCTALHIFPGKIESYVNDHMAVPYHGEDFPIGATFQDDGTIEIFEGVERDPGKHPAMINTSGLSMEVPEVVENLRTSIKGYLERTCPCDVRFVGWMGS